MDNDEDEVATFWVDHILFRFAFHRHVGGLSIDLALDAVRDEMGPIVEPMMARAATVGHIPGVHVGDEFNIRAEVHLVGLHDDMVRGISLGVHYGHGHEVATSAVAVFVRHNTFLDDDLVIYGAEGGNLRDANQLHVRVLANQRWTRRNVAMRNSCLYNIEVRLIVRSRMPDNAYRYNYLGLFRALDWREVMSNGFRVYEFLLHRVVPQ